jgi:hypothetical protein
VSAIKALRAALAADITPLPWITAGPSFGDPLPRYTTAIVQDTDDDCAPDVVRLLVEERNEQEERDIAYIAAACNAAPELLAERDALRAALEGLMTGNVYKSFAGEPPAWHQKSIPRDADLTRARAALKERT